MCSDSSSTAPILVIEGLVRSIRGRPILRGVDLEVGPGEVVGLLGPNGAGKTTTFRAVAGLDRPDGGRVIFRGEELGDLPLHRRAQIGMGYLPQEPSVFRGLTVEENLVLVLELAGKPEPRREARRVLEELDLAELAGQRASTLSGGERRRLELARAMSLGPRLLLCDEPLTGVDPKAAADLRRLIRELARKGTSVLLTDHNVSEALRACDRASLLVDGAVIEQGSASELLASSRARAAYFGDGPWPGAGS